MERLTFDGLFCDIVNCWFAAVGTCCESCTQRRVWERLKEYEDAEQEGRLVVLPCKVGDLVYISGHRFVAQIDEIVINADDGITFNWSEYDRGPEETELWDDGWFTPEDVGKTVFLTREAAETALKGGDG